ncbi:MAG: hypothetical protein IT536_15270 [Hyphomicrobiales bacterium]|nr:hypothetical protein [Hyphomicrobiales bacterium]
MKFGLLVVSTLTLGLLGSAAFSQDYARSRSQHVDATAGSLSRIGPTAPSVPEPEAARPPAGMLPPQPTTASRSYNRSDTAGPAVGGALRNSLRN